MPYTPTPGTRPEDLNPNAFQPVGDNGYASQTELYTLYDRPIPEQMWLFERHANYVGFATMLKMMGFNIGSDTPTMGHYEQPWLHDQVEVGAIITAATAAGESEVISIAAAAHYDTGATVGGAAREATYPVVGDVVELTDRIQVQVTAKDTSVVPNQITLTPLKAADDITGIMDAGEKFSILYNLHAEASGLPKGRAPRIMKYNNTFGLVKHSFGSTGFELTNSVYHETVPGDPGSAGDSIIAKIKVDEIKRYEHAKSGMLMFGQQPDNITSTATELGTDVPIEGTEGFIDFATTAGTIDGYTVGSYAIGDFDVIANTILDERSAATNDVMGWIGPDLYTEIENVLIELLDQNQIYALDRLVDGYANYAQQYHENVTNEPADATVSFGYTAVRKNGFTFHLKRLSEFADIRRAGAGAYNYRNWGIWHPLSWTTDALNGNSRPSIGYEYKALGNYSRENVFGKLPGAGVGGDNTPFGQPVSQYDTIQYFLMSHCGFHGAIGNALVVQQPA